MATNAAYDLSRFETNGPARIRVVKNESELRREEDRRFLTRLAALGVAVACLAVYTVYSNMLLTKTKSQITQLSAELTELQSENVYLDYQIESMLSVEKAEDHAIENGLIKLAGAQVEYVNIENENKIVEYDNSESFKMTMTSFLDTVLDMANF